MVDLFTGDAVGDMETAKRLIAAHPNLDLRALIAVAEDPERPEASRIAAIYALGFTDDEGLSVRVLQAIVGRGDESAAIRDHAAEALDSLVHAH
jgi:hypothetical protein